MSGDTDPRTGINATPFKTGKVKCSRCGFICDTERDLRAPYGSRMGQGLSSGDADAWVTSTYYIVDDIVLSSSINYICLVAHTSGTFATDLASLYWEVYRRTHDAWITGKIYEVDQYVTQSSTSYKCLVKHTSGTFATDLASAYWVAYTDRVSNFKVTSGCPFCGILTYDKGEAR